MKRIVTTCIAIAAVLTVGGCSSSEPDAPAACMRAIDVQQEALLTSADAFGAISRGDVAGMDAATAKIQAMDTDRLGDDIATCRAAAE